MINKTIHYCWFGGKEKTKQVKKCIKTWKKYCPDFDFKEWNEKNFDLNCNLYVKQAYENKKWAFITDYVRLYALYTEGGIYMDTDVEVLKPLDKFLKHKAFSSFENNNMIPTGIMGAEKGNKWIKDLLDEYKNLSFQKEDGSFDMTTNVIRITNLTVKKYGLVQKSSFQELRKGVVTIYPYDYFCPKSWETGKITITANTHTIHHFSGSWLSKEQQRKLKIDTFFINLFGKKRGIIIAKMVYYLFHPFKLYKKMTKKGKE